MNWEWEARGAFASVAFSIEARDMVVHVGRFAPLENDAASACDVVALRFALWRLLAATLGVDEESVERFVQNNATFSRSWTKVPADTPLYRTSTVSALDAVLPRKWE